MHTDANVAKSDQRKAVDNCKDLAQKIAESVKEDRRKREATVAELQGNVWGPAWGLKDLPRLRQARLNFCDHTYTT